MAAGRLHGALDAQQRAPALPRLPEQVGAAVALPDRRLVPDEDPGPVEAGEQPVVHEVVRAGDVRAQLLQIAHDGVHVRARERRAVAGHVLVDRRAPELHAAIVQVEEAPLHRHRAKADAPAYDLHHLVLVAQDDAGRVELGVAPVTRARGRARARLSWSRFRAARWPREAEGALRVFVRRASADGPPGSVELLGRRGARAARRSAAPRGSFGPARGSAPSTWCPAPGGAPGPRAPACTGRTMPFQFHQPSSSRGSLRPSTTTTSSFSRPGRRPRASTVKGV